MSDTSLLAEDPDFEIQMKSLAEEAEHLIEGCVIVKAPQAAVEEPVRKRTEPPTMQDLLAPLAESVEELGRAMNENALSMSRLEKAVAAQRLPNSMTALQDNLDQKTRLNQKMFDALHEELRTYKDEFLLELLHRPVVQEMIRLFDDLSSLNRHTTLALEEAESRTGSQLQTFNNNLEHIVHSVLEILARLQVQRLETSTGKLDKQRHRVVSVEPTSSKEEDQQILASVKPGFVWRDRVVRPEEVVVRKWKTA